MLTLLTATGARPEAFALCERAMAAQDFTGYVRWVIVDDGPQAQRVTFHRDRWLTVVLRPAPVWQPGQNTQARNLTAGLQVIDAAAAVVVIEDDDYYAPDYLTWAHEHMVEAELIGERRARYYNLASGRYRQLHNMDHASLCATALHGSALAMLRDICAHPGGFIDLRLWQAPLPKMLFDGNRVVGIKGLPGRPGIGIGHQPEFGAPDPDRHVFREWVGDGARLYG